MIDLTKTILLAVAVTSIFSAATAWAQNDVKGLGEVVTFQKSQLSTAAGTQEALVKIAGAAERACGAQFVSRFTVKTKTRYQRCLRENVKYMVRRTGHPALEQAYLEAINTKSKPVRFAAANK